MIRAGGNKKKYLGLWKKNCTNQWIQDTRHPQSEMDKKHMKSSNMRHERLWSMQSKSMCSTEKLSHLLKAQQQQHKQKWNTVLLNQHYSVGLIEHWFPGSLYCIPSEWAFFTPNLSLLYHSALISYVKCITV